MAGAEPIHEQPSQAAPADNADCADWVAEYALAARLTLTDTPHGAGDGVYDIGPGRLKIRFSRASDPGAPVWTARLLAYEMHTSFVVDSKVLFIRAKVTTRAEGRATPDAQGVIADGRLAARELSWKTPFRGHRTDGKLFCEGFGCGFSGVPPSGESPLHIGPSPVMFGRFVFDSAELKVFRMASTKTGHTEMPRQTSFISISGQQLSRKCLVTTP